MAKKNNSNGVENKNNDGGEKKKADGPIASKFIKLVKSFEGAESVKSDNDKKAKQAPLKTAVMKVDFQSQKCATRAVKIAASTIGCHSVTVDMEKGLLTVTGSMDAVELVGRLRVRMPATILSIEKELVPLRKKVGGNDKGNGGDGGGGSSGGDEKKKDDDNNDEGNGGGGAGGDEKKKGEDEGNGVDKMKHPHPAGQYGFGQLPYRKVQRHEYGYQNGALKMVEKMLMCCEDFGLPVMYNHLAKDIYTMSIHNWGGVFSRV